MYAIKFEKIVCNYIMHVITCKLEKINLKNHKIIIYILFNNKALKKCDFDVYLLYFPILKYNKGKICFITYKFYHKSKFFIVINSFLLYKSLYNLSSFITLYFFIKSVFNFIYPLFIKNTFFYK